MRNVKPEWQEKIARERIQILFDLAKKEIRKKPERSRHYVELARKIGTRYKVRFSKDLKEKFCKKCNSLLIKGKTVQIKPDKKTKSVIVRCKNCKYSYRKLRK